MIEAALRGAKIIANKKLGKSFYDVKIIQDRVSEECGCPVSKGSMTITNEKE